LPHGKLRSGGSQFEASPGKWFARSISKITRAKWTGGVIQAVECLLCKHEALTSNPNSTEKKIRRDKSHFILIKRTIY
jgi:Zn ribbon nucleic-acid-binding protein